MSRKSRSAAMRKDNRGVTPVTVNARLTRDPLLMTTSNYVIPFRALLRQAGIDHENKCDTITVTRDQLLALIRNLLAAAPFDEVWYKKTYPDIDQAIAAGKAKSAKDHYLMNGYFEGRWPGPINVDEKYYTSTYPDIAEGVDSGEITSAQSHFESHGYLEGRLPYDIER
jgi:hypothetical protein